MKTMTREEIENATENLFKKHFDDTPIAYLVDNGNLVDIKKTKEFDDEMKKFFSVNHKMVAFDKDGNEINGKV